MSFAKTLHPSWIWLSVVAALLGLSAWVALTRDAPSPQDPRRATHAATAASSEPAQVASPITSPSDKTGDPRAGLGFGGGSASPAPIEGDHELEPREPNDPHPGDPATLLGNARSELAAGRFADARRSALECLKAEPANAGCAKARVHSYTQQYPLSETSEIVRWCLSAFASDLNCLRQLRVFHQSRAEDIDASGISAEIRARFPDANLELPQEPEEVE